MTTDGKARRRALSEARTLLCEGSRTSFEVFKIILPISVIVRLLQQAGLVGQIGELLAPVMSLVGLPGEMGMVWATALCANLYGAMVVFVALLPGLAEPMSVAQTTVLTTMLLLAHGMPAELRICQKAGPRMRAIVAVRIGGALALGWVLWQLYTAGGWLTETTVPRITLSASDPTWWGWAQGQFWLMLKLFGIIMTLLLVMKILEWTGATDRLNRLLAPLLRGLGMTPAAAPLAIIGMTLGITYGGGLIIRHAQSGKLPKRDIFFSLVLMSLCHSIIEDTLLMLALGADISGVLIARLAFSLLVTFALVRILSRVSEAAFDKWLFRTGALKVDARQPGD